MDCIIELQQIEQGLNGTLEELGTIIANVQDPVEQMVLAVKGTEKYRDRQLTEALNFSLPESIWRVAIHVKKHELKQQEALAQTVVDELWRMFKQRSWKCSLSDKNDYLNKNKQLAMQDQGQLTLWDE